MSNIKFYFSGKVCYLTSVFEEISSFKEKAPSLLETVVSHANAKGMNI